MAQIEKSIIIGAPLQKVFDFWSRVERFPAIIPFVKEVRQIGPNTYHWKIEGPGGKMIQWDAEISKLVPNEQIGGRVNKADVHNSGMVVFHEIQQGTRVSVVFKFELPLVRTSEVVASEVKDPEQMLEEALKCIKSRVGTNPCRFNENWQRLRPRF